MPPADSGTSSTGGAECCCAQKGPVIQAATNVTINYNNYVPNAPAPDNKDKLIVQPPNPPIPPPVNPDHPVIRKEFRTLPKADQERFCNAVEKMMEVKPNWKPLPEYDPAMGPPPADQMPCEYFRLASYHGWPFWGDWQGQGLGYCAHSMETFPAWHRAYIVEFERALQAADLALGNDGRIALHYWGWDTVDENGDPIVNGQVMPRMIRDRFPNFQAYMIPPELARAAPAPAKDDTYSIQDLLSRGYAETSSEEELKNYLKAFKVRENIQSAMSQLLHSRAASTANQNNRTHRSIEEPHNMVHNACGFPMSDVPFAAFHPIFWLHHANVDRQYEAYLQNAMSIGLNPQNIGYQYDSLPEVRPVPPAPAPLKSSLLSSRQPAEHVATSPHTPPTIAIVEDVDPKKFRGKSFNFHFFIVKKGSSFLPPSTDPTRFDIAEEYAGADALFGPKYGPCPTCDQRGLINMKVNVSQHLQARGLARSEVRVEVVVQELGPKRRILTLDDLGLPRPKLMGPVISIDSLKLSSSPAAAAAAAAGAVERHFTLLAAAAPPPANEDEFDLPLPPSLPAVQREANDQALKLLAMYGYMGKHLFKEIKDLPAKRAAKDPADAVEATAAATAAAQQQPKQLMRLQGEQQRRAAGSGGPPPLLELLETEASNAGWLKRGHRGGPLLAAASAGLDPADNRTWRENMSYLQGQLGLKDTGGLLDEGTLAALSTSHRYDNMPEWARLMHDGADAPEVPTFSKNSTVYWAIEGTPCYLDEGFTEQAMAWALGQWAEVTKLTFVKVNADDSAAPDLLVKFTWLENEKKDLDAMDFLDVNDKDNLVYPHHLSMVEKTPAVRLPVRTEVEEAEAAKAAAAAQMAEAVAAKSAEEASAAATTAAKAAVEAEEAKAKAVVTGHPAAEKAAKEAEAEAKKAAIAAENAEAVAEKDAEHAEAAAAKAAKAAKLLQPPTAGGKAKIILDSQWPFWMLSGITPEKVRGYWGAFYLGPVLLHDIGSAVGLYPSGRPEDVMCPFYSESHPILTQNDKYRAAKLYGTLLHKV